MKQISYICFLISIVKNKPSANMIGQTENLMGVSTLCVMNEKLMAVRMV